MKALKTLGILILLLIVLGLIASLILPKEVHTEQSVTINAPSDVVWKYISSHETFDAWSPWNKLDSNMKTELVGEDGTVGAIWKWDSESREVGKGEREYTRLDRDSGIVETALRFDGMNEARSWITMTEGENGVEVKWGMHNDKIGIPDNLLFALFWKGKMVDQFNQGLADLKEICENHKEEGPKKPEIEYDVTGYTFPTTTYVGNKVTVKMADMKAYMDSAMPAVYMAAKDVVAGPPATVYFEWDEKNGIGVMTAAMPVSTTDPIEGHELYTIDSGNAISVDYFGNYDGIGSAYEWLMYHVASNKLEYRDAPAIEQYMNDPMSEPDTAKWHTKVTFMVK